MLPTQKTTLVIADNHALFRVGLTTILNEEKNPYYIIVAEAANGIELIDQVEKYQPNIVITDINMPGIDGINACKIIKEKYPLTAVIALSLHEDSHSIESMMTAGASGYLLKTTPTEEILLAVKTVMGGKQYYCDRVEEKIMNYSHLQRIIKQPKFSGTEIQIIQLLCSQMTNKEIAKATNLHVRSIEDHRQRIQEKMDVKNGVGIAMYAAKYGIIKLDATLNITRSPKN